MKKCFTPKEFSEIDLSFIKASNSILEKFIRQGYTMSVRQVYYQLVAHFGLPNVPRSYEKLSKVLTDARMAGLVDWDHIVDRGRVTTNVRQWSGPKPMLVNAAKSFRINKWINQPVYVEVMVEKQALEGVLEPVCAKYGVNFTANKGYSSASAMYAASLRIRKAFNKGKSPVVLYSGDLDASGVDMTRDIRDRLKLMCECEVDVKRISLNPSQVEEHNLPPNPAKMSDSRASKYVKKYGESSWELDALAPNVLAGLISSAIKRRIEPLLWKIDTELEEKSKAMIMKMAKSLEKLSNAPKQQPTEPDDED